MGGERAQRLLVLALAALFAGVLALPAKLAPSPDRTRVAIAPSPVAAPRSTPRVAAPVVPVASPPPARREHAIQPPDATDPAGATAPAPAGAPGSSVFRDRAPIAPAPTTDAARHVYGLVIGINDYPGTSSDLNGAVPDAEDMSDVLTMYGVPAANVHTLLDGDATTRAINDDLDWLVQATNADSTVVVFYAGHVRKISDDTEAIVAADDGLLPDWYLANKLQGLSSHKVWIVMAACYGGGFTELMAPGRILTAAAGADDLAYENDSFDRSYLDEYLIHQALLEHLGAGPTAQQAFAYAQAGLERDYPDRTLTQIDDSTEAISLDGVSRPSPNPPSSGSSGTDTGGRLPFPSPSSPPPGPPSAPAPCRNLLGLLCPPGSR